MTGMTANDHLDCFEPELVVIPCGSRKMGRRARAADMYVGSYHRACRRAADALRPDRLLILSARYGLLDLDDVIDPYDTPHGAAGAITDQDLLEQAALRHIVRLDPVVALGGARHVSLVRTVWPHARTPLAGTRGMGEQMARLAMLRKGRDQQPM
ncbi:hypothetical protein SAMN02745898_1011009 [Streptomyces sp. 136MFCol5.1]|uniref:DUF6884 domain-containing protein n=2 Tax=Streptomyces TaxID=1883 RepID=UPI00087F3F70|nr:DUF6884 domain-containing protein [Streptomyces sp. 136MFCol5.1]SCY14125.1 hypothetical protein SAMN02745898_1011009 [Streptomyces sp. 136MFCol5.1]